MSTPPSARIEMKLDGPAMAALFADPVAKIELQRAVVAEVCKKLFPNYINAETENQLKGLLKEVTPELLAIARDEKQLGELVSQRLRSMKDNLRGQVKLGQHSDELIAEVDARIRKVIEARIEERSGKIPELVDAAVDRVLERIERSMDRWVTEKVEARIQQGIEERITKMRAALA